MRTAPLVVAIALLAAACGPETGAGGTPAVRCPDGSPGPDCGGDPPLCPDGTVGPDCEDPGPPCRLGERFPCRCADGDEGERRCGEEACVCGPEACSLRHAAGLDFGNVPPGVAAERTLELVNDGNLACHVEELRLEGCATLFALAAGAVEVPARSSVPVPVFFRAEGAEELSCALRFRVDDVYAGGDRVVGLHGRGDATCLAIDPPAVDFGEARAACGRAEAEVTIANGCSVPVRLADLALDAPEAFLLIASPPVPTDVPAGGTLPLAVGFRPPAAGSHAGALRVGLAGLAAVEIPLAGAADNGPWQVDTFVHAERPKVDLLYVIDNASSMADDLPTLLINLRPFLSFAQARAVDYHIAITTTGLEPGGNCPGGVGGGEDGRLFPVVGSTPRILTPETPNLEAAWVTNLQVGACREGPNHLLEAAVRALTPPVVDAADDPRHDEANDGNAGFLRPEAHLSVIAITDRADTSPEAPAHYYNALQGLKGFRNPHLFSFSAVTGDRRTGCARDTRTAPAGDRLLEVVERTDGGVFQSICSLDWEAAFREMSAAAFGFPQCFFLTDVPADLNADGAVREADGELEVRLDGEVVHERGAQGQTVWDYDQDRNALCFRPLATPEPGSTIDVGYHPVCP